MAIHTCPINPDCSAKLARLDERSKNTADAVERVEKKVDSLIDKVWGLKIRVALIAVGSSGVVAGILKYFLG